MIPPFNVVLVHPEIPPNVGNVIRLCANAGAGLHLIEPIGFPLDDARMRRAGLDYHEMAPLRIHPDWDTFIAAQAPSSLYALTTRGDRRPDQVRLQPGDWFVFGAESTGLPPAVLASIASERHLRLAMRPFNRSMNLSNAVAVVVYEAWRQQGFDGTA